MKKAAVCLFVRNEERDIQEWIAYHIAFGFESVIIYDNGSEDNTIQKIRDMSRVADIMLIDWSIATSVRAQLDCYEDCCKKFQGQYEWIAFLDSDEFLVGNKGGKLQDILTGKFFDSMIAFNWACFGSNGHVDPPNTLTITAFTRRSKNDFDPNNHTKVMVRPESVIKAINPHYLEVNGPTTRADGNSITWHRPGITTGTEYGGGKVNHYFVRSRHHWARKITRGYRDGTVRKEDLFSLYDRNDVEDLSAASLGPEVANLISSAYVKVKPSVTGWLATWLPWRRHTA